MVHDGNEAVIGCNVLCEVFKAVHSVTLDISDEIVIRWDGHCDHDG